MKDEMYEFQELDSVDEANQINSHEWVFCGLHPTRGTYVFKKRKNIKEK
jgi:hypothetical protein